MDVEQTPRLGEHDALIELTDSGHNRELAQVMARQARRSIYIVTRDLEHGIYDTPGFVDAAADLVRGSRYAEVHVLVRDSTEAVKNGHRLVNLSQRLSSKVSIRNPPAEFHAYNEALLIVDETAFIRRPLADRYEGTANFCGHSEARRLTRTFQQMWERAVGDPQLRRLHL